MLIRTVIAVIMIVIFAITSIIHFVVGSKVDPVQVEPVDIDDLYSLKQQVRLSQSNKKIPFTKKDMHCMTQNIFFEAGTEDVMGNML